MNIWYLIYQAERPKTVAEQRAADVQTGKFAASVARLGSSVKQAVLRSDDRNPGLAADAAAGDGGVSIADLERLYAAADGECTVRS